MAARKSAKVALGATQREIVNAINILDSATIVEFTPASAADDSRPDIKLSHGTGYIYVQIEAGTWKRAALSTW